MAVLKSQLVLSLHDQVSGRMKAISAQVAAFQTRMRAVSAPFLGMTARLAAVGGGYLAVTRGVGGTVGAAIKFEEAFADVRKVLDASEEQFGNVRRQILGLSKVLPNSAEGIANIYAAAAQANIPMGELGKFTEMVAKISVAWDVAEGETSQALAEIKNQLHLSVDEIGLYADAINHLSNNSAARAPDLVDFSKRVAAQGEMFGFAAAESLAFGGAMIASGARTNVAATSFRNMGMALADAANAPKRVQGEFKKLGLNTKKLAKEFNTDAVGTMLDVFERIQALPEHERLSTAIGVFGSEARALMPLINSSKELRRQLELVGDKTKYAGSAFKEYMERANTTSNVLAIMRNRIRAIGIEMGDKWLPTIKEVAIAFSDVFDTMGDRVTPFKRMETAIKGFMQGLGYDGSIRDMIDDLADLFFGKIDPAEGADQLGQLFMKMKSWGAAVREFSDAIRDNPIAKFVADIAGEGFKLMLATMGIGLLAGAVKTLGRAMMFLSGASAAIAIIKSLAGLGGVIFGGLPGRGKPDGKPGGRPGVPNKAPARGVPGGVGILGLLGKWAPLATALVTSASSAGNEYTTADAETRRLMREQAQRDAQIYNDAQSYSRGGEGPLSRGRGRSQQAMPGWSYRSTTQPVLHPEVLNSMPGAPAPTGMFDKFLEGMRNLAPERDPLPTLEQIREQVSRAPTGTHDVREINPTPVHAPINVTVYATTNADPNQIAAQVGARVQDTIAGYYGTSAYG